MPSIKIDGIKSNQDSTNIKITPGTMEYRKNPQQEWVPFAT